MSIVSPSKSFIQFGASTPDLHCIFGAIEDICLPVYDAEDVYFQFVLQAETSDEADDLCGVYNTIQVGLVADCEDADFLLEFNEQPERFRISPLQVLYNWSHGLPSFVGAIDINECFHIRIQNGVDSYCSNCLQRIGDDCFTSVIEYGNDENAFGFNYCNSGSIGDSDDPVNCSPTEITFIDKATLTIPYTAALRTMYGDYPNVQAWVYIDGVLQNPGIQITMDGVPPSSIDLDFGGVSTGVVIIR